MITALCILIGWLFLSGVTAFVAGACCLTGDGES